MQYTIHLIKKHTECEIQNRSMFETTKLWDFICTTYALEAERLFHSRPQSALHYGKLHSLTLKKVIIWYKFVYYFELFL